MQSTLQYSHHDFEEGLNFFGCLCIQNHFKNTISDIQGYLWLCSKAFHCKLNSDRAKKKWQASDITVDTFGF